jgi:hypothetical protein
MQEPLPRLRTDGKAEQRIVVAMIQVIPARLLPLGPAHRQVPQALDCVVDNGAVAHGRPQHLTAPAAQRVDQGLQAVACDDRVGPLPPERHASREILPRPTTASS